MKKCLLQDFNMNGIYDALKAVVVEITWNGGKQEETIPLNLKK